MSTVIVLLDTTAQKHWEGRRCYSSNMSQAKQALGWLYATFKVLKPEDITKAHLEAMVADMQSNGYEPSTITKRLNTLSVMGIDVTGCRPKDHGRLKWWLKPEDEVRVLVHLRQMGSQAHVLANLIYWTTRTGLRIEESLRLTWRDLVADGTGGKMAVSVPGTKTQDAQATLPLGDDVATLMRKLTRTSGPVQAGDLVFPITYDQAKALWRSTVKPMVGPDDATCTLKALRRSAARYLHIQKGMPLDMVREYLRHRDIETTMGYLKLTGGYGTEEMRRWL